MAGEFKGITDEEWALFEDILPPEHKTRGMPHSSFRYIINTLLYVEITGCRWCDVPKGPQWGATSHRWLKSGKKMVFLKK